MHKPRTKKEHGFTQHPPTTCMHNTPTYKNGYYFINMHEPRIDIGYQERPQWVLYRKIWTSQKQVPRKSIVLPDTQPQLVYIIHPIIRSGLLFTKEASFCKGLCASLKQRSSIMFHRYARTKNQERAWFTKHPPTTVYQKKGSPSWCCIERLCASLKQRSSIIFHRYARTMNQERAWFTKHPPTTCFHKTPTHKE